MAEFNANAERWPLMFYPYNPAASDTEAARFLKAIGRDLFTGRSYQVTTRMVRVLRDVFDQTLEGMEHVEPEEMPSESGFLWYDEPLQLRERKGGLISIRAMSWGPQPVYYRSQDLDVRLDVPAYAGASAQDGVRVAFWSMAGDPGSYQELLTSQVSMLGDLQLNHCMSFAYGTRFPKRVEGKQGESVLHYAHLTWILLGAEISVHQRAHADRKMKPSLRKSVKHGDVSVIVLRRARPRPDEPRPEGHRQVDWKWRWFVQSFWRHIEGYEMKHHRAVSDGDEKGAHCTICGARVTRVREFVKGPPGRPLKQSKQLYRLTR
jgi:hypothetical protein